MIGTSSPQDALEHAIKAAELYMRASREAQGTTDRSRIRGKIEEMITLAEYLKSPSTKELIQPKQDRQLTPREMVALLQSSKLNGNNFPPWRTSHADPGAFAPKAGQDLYTYAFLRSGGPTMRSTQLKAIKQRLTNQRTVCLSVHDQ